jgi:nucleotide-binding universal stress UspA family protein
MVTLNKILVATDFGEASAAALRYGRELATAFAATLHVLHVAEDLSVAGVGVNGYAGLPPEVLQDIERAARRHNEELLTDDDRRLLKAQAITITSNRFAAAIVDYARANAIDLIVVGTHGRRALSRMMLGSVAERVVRTAPCPVLTVHSLQHEFVTTGAGMTPEQAAISGAARA